MATPNKTIQTDLVSWQDITTGNVVISSALNVATVFSATVFVRVGRRSGTAFTAGWPNVRIEASKHASNNNSWIPLVQFQPALGTSIANTTLTASAGSGSTTFVVSSATNIAVGDIIFLGYTVTASAATYYELCRVRVVSGTTITPEEALVNDHDLSAPVTDQAEMYVATLDLGSITRIRAVVDNINSGQTMTAEIIAITEDSIA